jgi:hypothetical protein
LYEGSLLSSIELTIAEGHKLASCHAAVETEVVPVVFAPILILEALLQAVASETVVVQIAVVMRVMVMVIIVLRLIGLRLGHSVTAILGISDPAFARKGHLVAD